MTADPGLDPSIIGMLAAAVAVVTSIVTTLLVLVGFRARRRLDVVKGGENPQDDAVTRLTRAPDPERQADERL